MAGSTDSVPGLYRPRSALNSKESCRRERIEMTDPESKDQSAEDGVETGEKDEQTQETTEEAPAKSQTPYSGWTPGTCLIWKYAR